MKIFLLILLSITVLFAQRVEQISIDNKSFNFVRESYDDYGTKGEVLRIYKGDDKNQSSMLLSFILREKSGSCSATEREKGMYEINASTITFYSSWKRSGRAYTAPVGVSIKVYEVLSDGSLKKVSSKVYIEASKKNYDKESGMQYLFIEPKTEKEKKLLEEYVQEIEKEYEGVFVFGKEADALRSKVKKAFKRKLQSAWRRN